LTSESPWQHALAHRLAEIPGVSLKGIVVQRIPSAFSLGWIWTSLLRHPGMVAGRIAQRIAYQGVFNSIQREAIWTFGRGGNGRGWPEVARWSVEDINDAATVTLIRQVAPEMIAVSGTTLLKEPVCAIAPAQGIIGLHTGLAPYYKGGPNCTLWCLANHEPALIGATVYLIDAGIDSGDLLLTGRPVLSASDNIATLVCKTISTGIELYARVVTALAQGRRLQGIPQRDVGAGRTFLKRDWRFLHMARAVGVVRSGEFARWIEAGMPGREQFRLVNAVDEVRDGSPVAASATLLTAG